MTALHGFLGLPTDWNHIECAAAATKPDWMPHLANLSTGPALAGLAHFLNRQGTDDGTLLGYSMGGRIALHMLVGDKDHGAWKRAIIVSASPGMAANEDRAARLANDERWAERFQSDDWVETIAAWNDQPVFRHDEGTPMRRMGKDFNRENLAKAIVLGSVAGQEDLRKHLPALEIPILWVSGELDEKYSALAKECAGMNPLFSSHLIPDAGHRSPWTHTDEFCEAVNGFLAKN